MFDDMEFVGTKILFFFIGGSVFLSLIAIIIKRIIEYIIKKIVRLNQALDARRQ